MLGFHQSAKLGLIMLIEKRVHLFFLVHSLSIQQIAECEYNHSNIPFLLSYIALIVIIRIKMPCQFGMRNANRSFPNTWDTEKLLMSPEFFPVKQCLWEGLIHSLWQKQSESSS